MLSSNKTLSIDGDIEIGNMAIISLFACVIFCGKNRKAPACQQLEWNNFAFVRVNLSQAVPFPFA